MSIDAEPPRRRTAKDEKREKTRAKLIGAARSLFAKHGYDDVPVTEIAREAGVTHSMINVYFGGKPGLLYEIVRTNNEPQYAEALAVMSEGGPAVERLSRLLKGWAVTDGREPRLLAVMEGYSWVWSKKTETENAADRQRFLDAIAGILEQGQATGEFVLNGTPETAATAIFAIFTWAMRNVVFEDKSPEACHADTMAQVRLLLHPA